MKKIVLNGFVLVCVMPSMASAVDSQRRYVDNFGKIWEISKAPCLDRQTTCIEGVRDVDHVMKCGSLSIRGSEATTRRSRILSVTVFPNEGSCKASAWIASSDLADDSYRGLVTDANGKEVEFTLVRARDGMGSSAGRDDPSQPSTALLSAPSRGGGGSRF